MLIKRKPDFTTRLLPAEQIALCQFIRDGHLAAQTRRLKRLYSSKLKQLRSSVRQVFGTGCQIQVGAAGTSLALTFCLMKKWDELKKQARLKACIYRF